MGETIPKDGIGRWLAPALEEILQCALSFQSDILVSIPKYILWHSLMQPPFIKWLVASQSRTQTRWQPHTHLPWNACLIATILSLRNLPILYTIHFLACSQNLNWLSWSYWRLHLFNTKWQTVFFSSLVNFKSRFLSRNLMRGNKWIDTMAWIAILLDASRIGCVDSL